MTTSGSSRLGHDSELDDPGRDPEGIGGPPRNPMGGGADQDSGRGAPPRGVTDEDGPIVPEPPAEDRR